MIQNSFHGAQIIPLPTSGSWQRSARVLMESRYRFVLPSLITLTNIFSVSILVSSLRLRLRLKYFQAGFCLSMRLTSFYSLGLSLVIETQTFSVLVSLSSLRLTSFQSLSCHWDSDPFSFGLDLVIETQTFSVLVTVLMIKIWSR